MSIKEVKEPSMEKVAAGKKKSHERCEPYAVTFTCPECGKSREEKRCGKWMTRLGKNLPCGDCHDKFYEKWNKMTDEEQNEFFKNLPSNKNKV